MIRSFITILFILTCLMPFSAEAFSHFDAPGTQEEERNRAIELFHSGRYAEALPLFKKLSDAYPSDYLLKYFTGASMIETGIYTKESEMNLLLAGTKDVPTRVFYYLARYYHAREDWDSALRFYNRFRNNSQPADIAHLNIEELVQKAFDRINPIAEGTTGQAVKVIPVNTADKPAPDELPVVAETTPPAEPRLPAAEVSLERDKQVVEPAVEPPVSNIEAGLPDTVSVTVPVPEQANSPAGDTSAAIITVAVPQVQVPLPSPSSFIRFQVNPQVTYLSEDLFQVTEAKEAWKKGTEREVELNELLGSLARLREQYQQTGSPEERDRLASQIIRGERHSLELRAESEQLIQRARQLEQAWWSDADYDVYEKYLKVNDSLARLEEAARLASLPPPPVIEEILIAEEPEGEDETVEEEQEQHGLIYKVQLGSFKGKIPVRTQALFDKISKIRTIETFENEDGATVYTTGNMKTFSDGLALQNQVRLEGVKDAFVIAIHDGKRIPLPDAKRISGEE